MVAWLYGSFAGSEVIGGEDAYSLFVKRSETLGWLTDAAHRWREGLWGMNDAGLVSEAGAGPALSSWFQVVVTPGSFPGTPVHPFLVCIDEVVAALGELRLEQLQVLLPAPGRGIRWDRAPAHLAHTAGWFAGRPEARASIELAVDGGQAPTVAVEADAIVDRIRSLPQQVFQVEEASASEVGGMPAPHKLADELWVGPPRHRLTLRGTIASWSLDALGWTLSLVAWASQAAGVTTPLLVTASCERSC